MRRLKYYVKKIIYVRFRFSGIIIINILLETVPVSLIKIPLWDKIIKLT